MEYNIPPNLGVADSTGVNTNWIPRTIRRGYEWDSSFSAKWKQAGKELRREITHLKNPLYTDSLTMSKIEFSADKVASYDSHIRWNLGHVINIQFELYGCPNYDLDKSK